MQKELVMRFERILENGRLWAVMYDGDNVNIMEKVFTQWNDYEWLRAFFTKHAEDLSSYFHITDIDRAVFDTVDDAENTVMGAPAGRSFSASDENTIMGRPSPSQPEK